MPGSVRARVGVILALAVLWLSAIAAPVSAAGAVRWVDNDSTPGDGPKKCNTAPYHNIQSAINNSNPYDTIYVCPGTYRQALHVDVKGLHIESIRYRKAKILPPASYSDFPALVSITAREVDFWNFAINVAGGDLGDPNLAANGGAGGGAAACQTTFVAIEALGPAADIRGNHIKATGDYTFSGECGYLYGIVLAERGLPGVNPDVTGPNVSSVSHNRVRDFKFAGILAVGEVKARIVRNAVRFVHDDDPATCVLTPVLGANPSLTFPCDTGIDTIETGINGVFTDSVGIAAEEGATVEIRANTVYSTFDTALILTLNAQGGIPVPSPETGIFLNGGIALQSVADGSTVRNNIVSNAGIGLAVFDDIPLPAEPDDNPQGSKFTGNRLNDSFVGVMVGADDGVYYGNKSRTNFAGIVVVEGSNNLFQANDARFNIFIDCEDDTSGAGDAGTANWWTNESEGRYNFGEYNDPEEICIPTFSPF